MEKTTMAAKRVGGFVLVEQQRKGGYKQATVEFTINDKKAEMVVEEKYKSQSDPADRSARMVKWHFVTGDKLVDSTAKIMSDFKMFEEVLDIIVDINDIIFDAENYFEALKAAEKAEADAKALAKREMFYDGHLLLKVIKPELEARGYKVELKWTKEQFLENTFRDMALVIEGAFDLHYADQYGKHGWVCVYVTDNPKDKVEVITKSNKTEKIVDVVVTAIRRKKNDDEMKAAARKAKENTKERLEAWLGEPVVQKSEEKGYWTGGRSGSYQSYTDVYFVRVSDPNGLQFREVNGNYDPAKKAYEKKFAVANFNSTFGDATKMATFVNVMDSLK